MKKAAKFARMLNNHSFGILTAWKHRISTGPLEGVNTRAKLIKRIGYGYNLKVVQNGHDTQVKMTF